MARRFQPRRVPVKRGAESPGGPDEEDEDPVELAQSMISELREAQAYLLKALEVLRPEGAKSGGGVLLPFRRRKRRG